MKCFDPSEALRAAEFVRCAYDPSLSLPDEDFSLLLRLQTDELAGSSLDIEDDIGLIAESDSEIIVAIRGTETIPEWIQDARCHKEPLVGAANVAEGFCDLYNAMTAVQPHLDFGKKVTLSGHSMGGALVSIIACFIWPQQPTVFTFASPNVGDRGFAEIYENLEDAWRIMIATDIVPHLPPSVLGFRGVGRPVVLNRRQGLIGSHELSTYMSALESLAGEAEPAKIAG